MKKNFKQLYIFLSFFIATIGNSSFLTSIGLSEIVTYAGIGLILLGIYYELICHANFQRDKKIILLFIIVDIFFCLGIGLQKNLVLLTKVKLMMTMLFISSLALLSFRLFESWKEARSAVYGVITGVVFATLCALIIDAGSLFSFAVEGNSSLGFNGGLQHKNYFACAMLICYAVIYISYKYKKGNNLDLVLKPLLLFMILISNSRGGWLLTLIFLIVINMDSLRAIKSNQKIVLFCFIFIFAIIVGITVYKYFVLKSASYMIRIRGFQEYLDLYKNDYFHLWFGNAELGWRPGDTYVNNVRSAIGWDGTVELSAVSIIVKNGILGFIGYFMIFLYYFIAAVKQKNSQIKIIILSVFIPFLFSGLVENYITNTHVIYCVFAYCLLSCLCNIDFKVKFTDSANV